MDWCSILLIYLIVFRISKSLVKCSYKIENANWNENWGYDFDLTNLTFRLLNDLNSAHQIIVLISFVWTILTLCCNLLVIQKTIVEYTKFIMSRTFFVSESTTINSVLGYTHWAAESHWISEWCEKNCFDVLVIWCN